MKERDVLSRQEMSDAGYSFKYHFQALECWANDYEYLFWYPRYEMINSIVKRHKQYEKTEGEIQVAPLR